LAGQAVAADIPAKAPRVMSTPTVVTSTWTGCFIGAGAGYGMYNQEVTSDFFDRANPALRDISVPITIGGRGWFGTVQAGCDYQFADRWVAGIFGDYDWTGLKGTLSFARNGLTIVGEEKQQSAWAIGGRVGYLIVPQLLAYVSGGYTEARFRDINPLIFTFTGTVAATYLPGATYKGWFIGTGYEYSLAFLPGLFWKTEYRFADYRAEDLPFTLAATGVATGDLLHSRKYIQTIRTELVWRFNWGGPVVARY
jgi:outer membrane immunogenic protein